jgi:CCR4-NOT transcription complex subunit 1
VATIVDRFIQEHPPNFTEQARLDLDMAIRYRYSPPEHDVPPTEVLAALYLLNILFEHSPLALYLKRTGSAFTADEEACNKYLRNAGSILLDEEQVGAALLYTAISRTPNFPLSYL